MFKQKNQSIKNLDTDFLFYLVKTISDYEQKLIDGSWNETTKDVPEIIALKLLNIALFRHEIQRELMNREPIDRGNMDV